MRKLYQLGNGQRLLGRPQLAEALKEAMDPDRFRLVLQWLDTAPQVGAACRTQTPYGTLHRIS